MKKFDVNALETLMIGDRINDFESAEKAGCKSIIIRRGEQEGNNDMNWVKNNMQLKDEIAKIFWQTKGVDYSDPNAEVRYGA